MIKSSETTLLFAILTAAIAGILCGALFGEAMTAVAWIGDLFLNALKMLILPIVITSVITGVANLGDIRKLGHMGALTIFYYASTTALAVLTGLTVVNLLNPGEGMSLTNQGIPNHREPMGITDILNTMISPNLVVSASEHQLLPIIIFCILFAAALTTIEKKNIPVISFFQGVNDTVLLLTKWLMFFAPIGIFAIIAAQFGDAGGWAGFLHKIQSVGWYIISVGLGLGIHFVFLFLLLCVLTKHRFNYLLTMSRALLTAFGTSSSLATLPVTMQCANNANVEKKANRLVLPLGATINMDGTALYEAVAVMFIAQSYMIDMSIVQQMIIFFTATLAAIGAAAIPQAGLVTMIIVLDAVNLPQEGIALILAVDWFLDRLRTTVNVWGDSVGTAIIGNLITKNPRYL